MKKLAITVAALAFAVSSTGASATVVLTNGGFESIGQQYSSAIGGLYEASGWVNTSQLNIQASSAVTGVEGTAAGTGARFLRLVSDNPNPANTGSIFQNLGTIEAGKFYVISGTALGGESINNAFGGFFSLASSAEGLPTYATTTVAGLAQGASQSFSLSFAGTAANAGQSVFLRLTAVPSGPGQDIRGGVDNLALSVSAVPEPTTWAMMLMGFGMVGFGLRSRRKPSVQVAYA